MVANGAAPSDDEDEDEDKLLEMVQADDPGSISPARRSVSPGGQDKRTDRRPTTPALSYSIQNQTSILRFVLFVSLDINGNDKKRRLRACSFVCSVSTSVDVAFCCTLCGSSMK